MSICLLTHNANPPPKGAHSRMYGTGNFFFQVGRASEPCCYGQCEGGDVYVQYVFMKSGRISSKVGRAEQSKAGSFFGDGRKTFYLPHFVWGGPCQKEKEKNLLCAKLYCCQKSLFFALKI